MGKVWRFFVLQIFVTKRLSVPPRPKTEVFFMKTQKIVVTALFSALVFVATYFLTIPVQIGYINFGDAFLLLAGVLVGPWGAGICGALGGAIADLASGFAIYAPFTLVVKFVEGVLCGLLFNLLKKRDKLYFAGTFFAFVVSALWMVFGYLITNTILYSFEAALLTVVNDLLQAGISVAIATVLFVALSHIPYVRHNFGLRPVFNKRRDN